MEESIEILKEFLKHVESSNRDTEDSADAVSLAISEGLESGISWAIDELEQRLQIKQKKFLTFSKMLGIIVYKKLEQR